MNDVALVNFAPALRLAAVVLVLVLVPLAAVWVRAKAGDRSTKLAALTAVTLFLTFDLVVFGAFTRLTDSGLGCPDWPGCYGNASPIGASADIHAAQTAVPGGPVTFPKAWIEMIHRYLAMTVGLLCLLVGALSLAERRRLPHSPWWATATLVWVVIQGLFGKYTVTWKLYPLIVTLHLLGGVLLLMLLALQHHAFSHAWREPTPAVPLPPAWPAADLVRSLVEARDKRELTRLERRLMRVDLLVLDELGFVPFDRAGGELLFNAIATRYERKTVLVTSNLSFSEWPKVFAVDEKLTTALLDRLADHATIVTTKGKSFRMRRRQTEASELEKSKDVQTEEARASAPDKAGRSGADVTAQRRQLKKR